MAEVTIQRRGELVRGVFGILVDYPEGLHVKDLLHRLESTIPPTPFEASSYPNRPQSRRYDWIIRFSTIAPVKAGWMIKNRGIWALTDEGRAAFDRYPDPEQFLREARRLYRQWRAERPESELDSAPVEDAGPASIALEEAEEAAWAEIEAFFGNMSPYDFQELVAGLLRGMGYFVEWVSPPGPDKGIDIVAHVDPLGVRGPRIKVQVKRRAERATVESIRGFMALLGESDVGLFICSGGFTRDAEEEARRQEKRRIMLLDQRRLFDLWTEHYERIPESQRQLLPLRRVHYLAPVKSLEL